MSAPARLIDALADRYTLDRELGQGGMATVYLAHDIKHDRKVAIKVLRQELSATLGSERFAREIAVAARLQHPHILGLLDSGEADGVFYYVMPYVDGETLRDRLTRGGELPVHEAVRLLGEITDALAAAHKGGVVHRDIKPENILLSGRHAMVMDFGVAKAVTESTGAHQLTSIGVALGTPAYMAPEQATADPQMDGRVDIYALGVLAYEMLTGQPPFHGLNPQQTLAAHVTQAPTPLGQRRPGLSPVLEGVVMRCLAKRPADRFQTADDLVTALEPLTTPSGGTTPHATVPFQAAVPARARRRSAMIAAAVLIAAIVVVGLWFSRRTPPIMALGTATQVSAELPGLKMQPAISPDGEWVAYVAGTTFYGKIFVRRIGGGRPIPLTDDSVNVEEQPRFSPDGKQILFLSRGGAYVAPAQGGVAVARIPGPGVTDALWSPDGAQVAFVRGDSLLVSGPGNVETRLVAHTPGLHGCNWAPNAELFACVRGQNNYALRGSYFGNHSPTAIVTITSASGAIIFVTDSSGFNLSPVWGPGRQLYFVRDQNHQRDIFTVAVTAEGSPRGTPTRISNGIGALGLGLTPDGQRLVYTKYASRANIWSLPLNPNKRLSISDAEPVTSGDQTIEAVRVSPDGKWLVFDSNLSGTSNIFRVPIAGGTQEQLTRDSVQLFAPDVSPDGTELAFHSYGTGTRDIFVLPLDGRPRQQVTATDGQESFPIWAPDGNALAYVDQFDRSTYIVKRLPNRDWDTPVRRMAEVGSWDWSADSRSLLGFRRSDSSLVVYSADSGAARVVASFRSLPSVLYPQTVHWSPDATTIYLRADLADTTFIWSLPTAGGTPRLLAKLNDPVRISSRADFAVDQSRLYFTLTDRQSDLWVVELKPR